MDIKSIIYEFHDINKSDLKNIHKKLKSKKSFKTLKSDFLKYQHFS